MREQLCSRTEKYYKEYAEEQSKLESLRREAKLNGSFFVEPEAKLLFVIRIKGLKKMAPRPRRVLRLFRLLQVNNGVFVRVNKASMGMMKFITPYVTFGYPDQNSVKNLLYRRGFLRLKGNRCPITDNRIIYENMADLGMQGIEDIIHEIYTVGPNFAKVNRMLWPFKLSCPRGGWKGSIRHAVTEMRGGAHGNREHDINNIILRMCPHRSN